MDSSMDEPDSNSSDKDRTKECLAAPACPQSYTSNEITNRIGQMNLYHGTIGFASGIEETKNSVASASDFPKRLVEKYDSGYDSRNTISIENPTSAFSNGAVFTAAEHKLGSSSSPIISDISQIIKPQSCSLPSYRQKSGDRTYFKANKIQYQIYQQDNEGDTQLHLAIAHSKTPLALDYIKEAPSFEFTSLPNSDGHTPLHYAVFVNSPTIVYALISAGANIRVHDHLGYTALHYAAEKGFVECAVQLTTRMTVSDYKKRCKHPYYKIRRQKIPQNLDEANYEGQTCLHLAAKNGHLEMVKLLCRAGANPNIGDGKAGRSPLHFAALADHANVVEALIQFGANVNALPYDKRTTVLHAVKSKPNNPISQRIEDLLRQAGATDITSSESSDDESESDDEDVDLDMDAVNLSEGLHSCEMADASLPDDIEVCGDPID